MEKQSAVLTFNEVFWETGLKITISAWIYTEHINWYYSAEPQFHDGTEFKIVQSFSEYISYGAPIFVESYLSEDKKNAINKFVGNNTETLHLSEESKTILKIALKQKEIILESNREFFEVLKFKESDIIHFGGDAMSNTEEFRVSISEQKALMLLRKYYLKEITRFSEKEIYTDKQLLENIT